MVATVPLRARKACRPPETTLSETSGCMVLRITTTGPLPLYPAWTFLTLPCSELTSSLLVLKAFVNPRTLFRSVAPIMKLP